jgi:hypothetical protein
MGMVSALISLLIAPIMGIIITSLLNNRRRSKLEVGQGVTLITTLFTFVVATVCVFLVSTFVIASVWLNYI